MSDRLPELIDPLVFAERRIELKGTLKITSLSRLQGLLVDTSGAVDVELFFNKQGRHAFIDGLARVTLVMQCQNCLEAVEVPITTPIKLGLVTALEQADRLPEGYEPLLVDGEKMLLKDIVEDELLLSIPTFPKHQHSCITFENNSPDSVAIATEAVSIKPQNPFAVLAKLKPTGDQ